MCAGEQGVIATERYVQKQIALRVLRLMPFLLAATVVFGIILCVVFNNGEPSEPVVNSWFVVGAIYFLVYHWNGLLNGEIYLWSAGTYTIDKEPIQFRLWIFLNSLFAIGLILVGLMNILSAS